MPVARFRRGPAYAKDGRERYGLHPATEHWFATCVAQGDETAAPLAARAARIYLDIAFFHPYDDGNARLAGLALQFVLLREQVELDDVAPILNVVRRADDAEGAADLARLIHGVAAATHRRRLRAHRCPDFQPARPRYVDPLWIRSRAALSNHFSLRPIRRHHPDPVRLGAISTLLCTFTELDGQPVVQEADDGQPY